LLKASVNLPSCLEFDDIIALDAVQQLSNTDPEAFALLEVFAGGDLEDYEEFNEEHDCWVDDNGSLCHLFFRTCSDHEQESTTLLLSAKFVS